MKENPFAPPKSVAKPDAVEPTKAMSERGFEIGHGVFRCLFAFFFVGCLPFFIMPEFAAMYEEFGMEVPLMTQYVVRFSELAASLSYVFLPLCFFIFASVEICLFKLPKGRLKTLLNAVYWLSLILVVGTASVSIWNVFSALTTSLTL